ncbi:MAG: hypothetical protein ACYCYA_03670 [Actinomycetes bacterium]
MALSSVRLDSTSATGLRLRAHAVAVPALASHVRPSLVLTAEDSQRLKAAITAQDVMNSGRYATTPAGVQVWDRPFTGPAGEPGDAVHLGTVDWVHDTPAKGYLTISRAFVTDAGHHGGASPLSILTEVLGTADLGLDGTRLSDPLPPARDPFRRRLTVPELDLQQY